ncbi:hypothetical protein Pmani_035185 [Petrolisthes manimaculis]|uniref:Uncharacterized protein n=1 Tax=Petrolisthes manimaculis TaxID=1843537 RepID=A0AAE1TNN8_9EUCA|nr:hypothetical protein Pmani_035185 [Petrolisthes manimaculis]
MICVGSGKYNDSSSPNSTSCLPSSIGSQYKSNFEAVLVLSFVYTSVGVAGQREAGRHRVEGTIVGGVEVRQTPNRRGKGR